MGEAVFPGVTKMLHAKSRIVLQTQGFLKVMSDKVIQPRSRKEREEN